MQDASAAKTRNAYIARINRVVDRISANLAEPLDLQRLAAIAHFSPRQPPRRKMTLRRKDSP